MKILNPLTNQIWTSKTLTTNFTTNQMLQGIAGYYSSVFGANVEINQTFFDSLGKITIDYLKSVKTVYDITVLKSLSQPTTTYVNFVSISTSSTI